MTEYTGTLVTDALDRVARQCSIKAPSAWTGATRDDHKEIRDDFLIETVEDLLDRVDWPTPIGLSDEHTVSAAEETAGVFTLETDFRRLNRDEFAVYDTTQDRPILPISSAGEYTNIEQLNIGGPQKYYRLGQYSTTTSWRLEVEPMSENDTIKYHYQTNLWCRASDNTLKSTFTEETDVLVFPRRLVEAGCVWRFRERRGMDFTAKRQEYELLLLRVANDMKVARRINFGGGDAVRWTEIIPSFIPAS